MDALTELMQSKVDVLLLTFLRASALVVSSPVFGHRSIPRQVKIGYAAALALLFFQTLALEAPVYQSWWGFAGLCAVELLFGLIIGFTLNLFFSVAITAGQIIDMQMGFGMATVYDPQFGVSVPVMGNFLNYLLLVTFFVTGGHQRLLSLYYIAMVRIPVGQAVFAADLGLIATQLLSEAFMLAVRYALPVIASGLLGEVAMGVIIRTVPQLNMFVIGMPVKVMLGFLVTLVSIPALVALSNPLFERMFLGLEEMFARLAALP